MAEVTLTSGYGTGLSDKQVRSRAWILDPKIFSVETVRAGNGSGNATALSLSKTVSLVTTATNQSHVSLGRGIVGQTKVIIHKTLANSVSLVIDVVEFGNALGATFTSDAANRSIILTYENDTIGWRKLAGETLADAGTPRYTIS